MLIHNSTLRAGERRRYQAYAPLSFTDNISPRRARAIRRVYRRLRKGWPAFTAMSYDQAREAIFAATYIAMVD